MNMISTGAFLNEMDASDKQSKAEKFAAAWEKKNAKAVRAGGVSLMALSLAACGGSSSTTTTTDTTTPAEPTTPVTPAGQTFDLTDDAVAPKLADALIGTSGNDTYNGNKTTIESTDIIIDQGGDADVANLSDNGDLDALTISGVETINVTINNVAAASSQDVNAANFSGVENLTITKGDVVVGGASIKGNKAIVVTNLDASKVAKVTAGADTTTVSVTQATKAGAVVDADAASGNVTVVGATTLTAAGAGAGDTVTVQALNNATEDAKDVSITTGAEIVKTTDNTLKFTGHITVDAASAKDVIIANATGGATITAKGDKGTAGTDGIKVTGVDASGVSVTTSYVGVATNSAEGEIQLIGTTGTDDAATVSAAGVQNLDLDTAAVENVTLSGNGAAATFNIVDNAATTYTKAGTESVTLAGDESKFSGATITGFDVLDLTAGTAGDVDFSKVSVSKIDLGFNNLGDKGGTENIFTVKSGTTFEITADQTDMVVDFGATETASDLNIIAGDVNGATNTAVGTLNLTDLDINSSLAGAITVTANDANFTTNTFVAGAKQTVTLSGDEDFTLGAVTAKSVDGTNVTGKISATSATSALTFTTGAGADTMTINGDAVHTIVTNGGNDTIDINDTKDASSFDAGAGDDVVIIDALGGAESIVVTLGDGDDKLTVDQDSDAIVVAGAGSDTLDVDGAVNFSDNANFSISGFEKLDIGGAGSGGTVTLSAAQLANNKTLSVISNDDTLQVTVVAAAGGALDASGITIASGSAATLSYTGSAKTDTITGGKEAETINHTIGGDSIDGGAGSDTFSMADTTLDATALGVAGSDTSTGAVINLSSAEIAATTVYAAISKYTGSNANIASNTQVHLYDANKTTNSTEITSMSAIENATGGDGADYIAGSGGANTLSGAAGNDYITAGDANDVIIGGAGNDTLLGGNGSDTFTFEATSNGLDTIKDFTVNTGGDVLDLDAIITGGVYNSLTALAFTSTGAVALSNLNNKLVTVSVSDITAAAADVDETDFFAASKIFAAEGTVATEIVVVVGEATGTDGLKIWQVVDGTTANDMTITQIGYIEGVSLTNLVAANFDVA